MRLNTEDSSARKHYPGKGIGRGIHMGMTACKTGHPGGHLTQQNFDKLGSLHGGKTVHTLCRGTDAMC